MLINHQTPIFYDVSSDGGSAALREAAALTEAEVSAPVEEVAPEAVPESTPEAAPEAPPAVDYSQRIQEWGGEERIQDALAIAEALSNREGIEALIREGAVALGWDPDAAFAAAQGQEYEAPDPDAIMTRAELEAELAKRDQSYAEQVRAQQEQVATSAVHQVLQELNVADADEERFVLTYAQRYVSGDELDPVKLQAAVRQGHQDYERALQAAAEKYVTSRQAKNESVPQPLRGGGAPAGEEEPVQIKGMEDAKAAARRFLKASGDA